MVEDKTLRDERTFEAFEVRTRSFLLIRGSGLTGGELGPTSWLLLPWRASELFGSTREPSSLLSLLRGALELSGDELEGSFLLLLVLVFAEPEPSSVPLRALRASERFDNTLGSSFLPALSRGAPELTGDKLEGSFLLLLLLVFAEPEPSSVLLPALRASERFGNTLGCSFLPALSRGAPELPGDKLEGPFLPMQLLAFVELFEEQRGPSSLSVSAGAVGASKHFEDLDFVEETLVDGEPSSSAAMLACSPELCEASDFPTAPLFDWCAAPFFFIGGHDVVVGDACTRREHDNNKITATTSSWILVCGNGGEPPSFVTMLLGPSEL